MTLNQDTVGAVLFLGMFALIFMVVWSLCTTGSYQPSDDIESNNSYSSLRHKGQYGNNMVVYVYMRSYDLFDEFQKLLALQMGDVDVRSGLPSTPVRSFTQSIDHASMPKEGIILYTVDASTMGMNAVDAAAADDQDEFMRLVLEYPSFHTIYTVLSSPENQSPHNYINSPQLDWITDNNITTLLFECTPYTTDFTSQESFQRLQLLVGSNNKFVKSSSTTDHKFK